MILLQYLGVDKIAEASMRLVKNVDRDLIQSSAKAKVCPICNGKYARMVPHFKSAHGEFEVFVSRISPEMCEMTKKAQFKAARYLKVGGQYMRAKCAFCEKEKNFSSYYWITHFRGHTGEYSNECQICPKMTNTYSHCGVPTERKKIFDLKTTDLTAFLCELCNFVQLDKENMVGHLRNHHEIHEISDQYSIITLLPKLNSLRMQANPNDPNDTIISGK